MSNKEVPLVCFSYPPIGVIGVPEKLARVMYGDHQVKVFTSEYTNLFYAPVYNELQLKSFFKVVCVKWHKDNGADDSHLRVVGVHAIGRGIDEMMQGFAVAISMGTSKQDFDNSIALHHPSASEEWALMDNKFADTN